MTGVLHSLIPFQYSVTPSKSGSLAPQTCNHRSSQQKKDALQGPCNFHRGPGRDLVRRGSKVEVREPTEQARRSLLHLQCGDLQARAMHHFQRPSRHMPHFNRVHQPGRKQAWQLRFRIWSVLSQDHQHMWLDSDKQLHLHPESWLSQRLHWHNLPVLC